MLSIYKGDLLLLLCKSIKADLGRVVLQAVEQKVKSKLPPIQEAVKSAASTAVSELLTRPCAPPLTWNVLKAMLLVMGKNPADMDTWLKCR